MSTLNEFEIKFSNASSPEEVESIFEEVVYYYLNDGEDIIEKMNLLALVKKICDSLSDSLNPCVDEFEKREVADIFGDDFGWDTK